MAWWSARATWQKVGMIVTAVFWLLVIAGAIKKALSGPSSPMFDPSASETTVISSIQSNFCTSPIQYLAGGDSGGGYIEGLVEFTCTGRDGVATADFTVYPSAAARQSAEAAGSVSCSTSSTYVGDVRGPSWFAQLTSADDASYLLDKGGIREVCH